MKWALILVLGAVTTTMFAAANPDQAWGQAVSAKQRESERKAVSAFAAGDYQAALNIYSELFADYRDPVYLRNIGRCYQRMKNPERAISSFEEYLSRAKRLSAEEKKEVNGYIDEMRVLQAQQQASAKPAPAAAPQPGGQSPQWQSAWEKLAAPQGQAPAPAQPAAPSGWTENAGQPGYGPTATPLPPAAPPADANLSASLVTQPEPAESNAGMRLVGKGALIFSGAMAIVSGVLLWSSWSKYSDSKDGKCLSQGESGCSSAADSISSRNLWSGITLGVAAASAIAGGTILYLYPATSSASGVQAGVAFRY